MAAVDCTPIQGAEVVRFVSDSRSAGPTYDWNSDDGALIQIFQDSSVRQTKNRIVLPGSVGSIQRHPNTDVEVSADVGGTLTKAMNITDANFYFGDDSGRICFGERQFALLEEISTFERYEYLDLNVLSWYLGGSEGSPIDLSLNVAGKEYRDVDTSTAAANATIGDTGASQIANLPGSDAAASTAELFKPLLFSGLTLTIGGDTFSFASMALNVSNGTSVHRYNNKVANCFKPGMRTATLTVGFPYNDETVAAFKDNGDAGIDDVTLAFARSSGANSVGFVVTLGLLKYADDGPIIGGDGDIDYGIQFNVYEDIEGEVSDVAISAIDTTW